MTARDLVRWHRLPACDDSLNTIIGRGVSLLRAKGGKETSPGQRPGRYTDKENPPRRGGAELFGPNDD